MKVKVRVEHLNRGSLVSPDVVLDLDIGTAYARVYSGLVVFIDPVTKVDPEVRKKPEPENKAKADPENKAKKKPASNRRLGR